MSFSSQGLKIISILDYIFFRLFPGGAFLFVVGKILVSIDESLRSAQSPWLLPFIVFEIFILASLLVWIFAGDEVYKQRAKPDIPPSFSRHLLGFIINTVLTFFFLPEGVTVIASLAFAGAVYTLGSFLLEFLLVLPSYFVLKGKDKRRIQKDLAFGFFGGVAYVLPLIWVSLRVAEQLAYPWAFVVSIACVMVSRMR